MPLISGPYSFVHLNQLPVAIFIVIGQYLRPTVVKYFAISPDYLLS